MTTKTWNFTLEGQVHTLILEHGGFSGKRTILLDGQLLENNADSVHEYEVDGHSVVVVIQSKFAGYAYDLLVDGISVDTGQGGPQRVGNTTMQGTCTLVVMVFLLGLGVSWIVKNSYDRGLAIQEWTVVTGKITGINTDYHRDNDDDSTDTSSYHAVLTVEYIIGDTRYTSQVDDDEYFDTDSQAFASHVIGERQMLYINPADPQEANVYFEKMDPNGWVESVVIVMGIFTILPLILLFGVWIQQNH